MLQRMAEASFINSVNIAGTMKRGLSIIFVLLLLPLVGAQTFPQISPQHAEAWLGETVTFTLSAPTEAGLPYIAAASTSRNTGFYIGNVYIDLDPTPLFFLSITNALPTVFEGFTGTLDAEGKATIRVHVPSFDQLLNLNIYLTFVTLSGSTVRVAPYASAMSIVPHYHAPVGIGHRLTQPVAALDPMTNDLYIFGGFDIRPVTHVTRIDFDQPPGMQIQQLDQLPAPRANSAVVYYPPLDKFYLFGGISGFGVPAFDTILVYDPRAPAGQGFSAYPRTLPVASNRYRAVYDPGTQHIFLFNTNSGSGISRNAYEFDPRANTWIEHADVFPAQYTISGAGNPVFIPGRAEILFSAYPLVKFDIATRRGSVLSTAIPNMRTSPAAVYDPRSEKVLFVDGTGNFISGRGEIYAYDPAAPPGTPLTLVATVPMLLRSGGAVYLPEPYQTVLYFGGNVQRASYPNPMYDTDEMRLVTYNNQEYQVVDPLGLDKLSSYGAARDPRTGKIYLFGGIDNNNLISEIRLIDFAAPFGTYTSVIANLPQATARPVAVVDPVTSMIYLFGGYIGGTAYVTSAVYGFDPSTRQITTMTSLPIPLDRTTAVWVPQQRVAYLFGGYDGNRPTDAVLRFDPAANNGMGSFQQVAALPRSDNGLAAVYDESRQKVYIAGGSTLSIYEFDPLTYNLLTLPATLPSYMTTTKAAWLRDRVYFFGSTYYATLSHIYAFDPQTMTVVRVGGFPQPVVYGYTPQAIPFPETGSVLLLGKFDPTRTAYLFS